MADDRVFIRCKYCGGWKMLLKFYTGGSFHRDNGILEWLDSHAGCHPRQFDMDLDGDPGFELLTESGDSCCLDYDKQNMEGNG